MKKKTAKKQQPKSQKRGFTLIEILVASTIIIVVSAIGLVSYAGAQVGARDATRKQDLENVRTVLLLYRTENGFYPIASLDPVIREAVSGPRRLFTRIAAVFRTPQAQAATDSEGSDFVAEEEKKEEDAGNSEDPGSEETLPMQTPPIFTSASPTPAPTSDTDTKPGTSDPLDKIAYQEMVTILVEEGYMQVMPFDPINDTTYYYGYNSEGITFTLTAQLEKDNSTFELTD